MRGSRCRHSGRQETRQVISAHNINSTGCIIRSHGMINPSLARLRGQHQLRTHSTELSQFGGDQSERREGFAGVLPRADRVCQAVYSSLGMLLVRLLETRLLYCLDNFLNAEVQCMKSCLQNTTSQQMAHAYTEVACRLKRLHTLVRPFSLSCHVVTTNTCSARVV